jgi:hypothetical protein
MWLRVKRWMPLVALGIVVAAGVVHGAGFHLTFAFGNTLNPNNTPWEF